MALLPMSRGACSVAAAVLAAVHVAGSLGAPAGMITLDKQHVPVTKNGRTVMYKTAYSGTVLLGQHSPQKFTVVFDTGSAHLFVPSSKCLSPPCQTHRLYERSASESAVDIDQHGHELKPDAVDRDEVSIVYGTGEIRGDMVRETVCLPLLAGSAQPVCARARVVVATELSTEPFSDFAFDGVLGLSLEGLAVDPEFSIFGQLLVQHPEMEPRFGLFLSRDDISPSEIAVGGHDERRLASDLSWTQVAQPELGFWLMQVQSVRVGNETLDLCKPGDCLAIADSGTSLLGVPKSVAPRVNGLLARVVEGNPEQADCRRQPGPDVVINLGGVELTIGPDDYSRPAGLRVVKKATAESQLVCRAQVLPLPHEEPLGSKLWILGEPVLRKYYSVFDWKSRRVGFGLASHPTPAPDASAEGASPVQTSASLAPTVVYI